MGARELDTIAANLWLLEGAARAVRALDAASVDALVLKGASLIDAVYAIDERRMADVDVLVRGRDLRRAEAALAELGAERVVWTDRPLGGRAHYACAYTLPGGVEIDVHTALATAPRWRAPVDLLFERSAPMQLNDSVAAHRLGNEDLLLYVAINQASDDFASDARPALDAARIVERLPIAWDEVVTRARAWRCTVALWLTLEHARRHAGAAIPERVRRALRPATARRAVLERLLALDAPTPYRFPGHSRRLRQLLVGPAVTDDGWRFAAATARFAALRGLDALAHRGGR